MGPKLEISPGDLVKAQEGDISLRKTRKVSNESPKGECYVKFYK